jgi:hypothetical protein
MSDQTVSVEDRIAALEQRVSLLERERPGRRLRPNVTSQSGVCGINTDCDSKKCPDASIYRYQQGCLGDKCVKINRDYYTAYREKRKQKNNED